jgi:hypothetical protein
MRSLILQKLVLYICAAASAIATPTPGLMVVWSRPKNPDLTEEVFNQWYTTEHIHEFIKSGLTDLVLRYKNVNKTAKWPYLALYRLPDFEKVNDPDIMSSIPMTSNLLPGKVKGSKGGAYPDIMDMDMHSFKRVQTFEGQIAKKGRGKGLSVALIEPANGTDADFDDWYRRQHLDMLR